MRRQFEPVNEEQKRLMAERVKAGEEFEKQTTRIAIGFERINTALQGTVLAQMVDNLKAAANLVERIAGGFETISKLLHSLGGWIPKSIREDLSLALAPGMVRGERAEMLMEKRRAETKGQSKWERLWSGGLSWGEILGGSADSTAHAGAAPAGAAHLLGTPAGGAAHLLDAGVDLVVLQTLLGHHSIRTTSLYTHISIQRIHQVQSPFDLLPPPAAAEQKAQG